MVLEGDGTLESLRKKKVVLIDGVHLTPSANIVAAISVFQIVGKGDTAQKAQTVRGARTLKGGSG